MRLQQILINLLNNAIKFTSYGEIKLSVSDVLEDNQAKLLFKISDTGIGIPETFIKKIFDAFSQVDSSNQRRYGGAGLGLTISLQLCRMMGGTMNVKNRIDTQGSIFSMLLPIKKP